MKNNIFTLFIIFLFSSNVTQAQHSIARQWNEMVLQSIRWDQARPTVHARNLFHTSVAMYDIWAAYEGNHDTYFLGKTNHGFHCAFLGVPTPSDKLAAQEEAISFAVFRLLEHRFVNSPLYTSILFETKELMDELGYDWQNTSTNYHLGAAEFGNYVAAKIIEYGLQDGSNEANDYANLFYEPVNQSLDVERAVIEPINDINRWQPLFFQGVFVGQSGIELEPESTPDFLSPEWGKVLPFALQEENLTIHNRDGNDYWTYHDPGPPPYLTENSPLGLESEYRWGMSMVSVWSSHLDAEDGVLWDISPASIGNIQDYPQTFPAMRDFYDFYEGGDTGTGHGINPKTGQAYEPQIVPRGDYTRVLAEFWADGPDSETPPGHWFTILNYVNDNPALVKKFEGEGEILSDLEWDVKGYFLLGAAMHDAAITAWGAKGYYDYIRPISAIRSMAYYGQSTYPDSASFHPLGLPIIPNFIEIINGEDDVFFEGFFQPIEELYGTPRAYAWESAYLYGGTDWILPNRWDPYQESNFVTPPFAGYVSGHSTFSRAAAEVLTAFTGDPFFPGGMGAFFAPANAFLRTNIGPSMDVTLQWATYRDASDQCSLSRIWGGIHPPADDIPGRLMGEKVGVDAFEFGKQYFRVPEPSVFTPAATVFPNPTEDAVAIFADFEGMMEVKVFDLLGKLVAEGDLLFINGKSIYRFENQTKGAYILLGLAADGERVFSEKVILF